MKQKMKPKMFTVNAPFRKYLKNETKMHFTYFGSAGKCSGLSNSPSKDSYEINFTKSTDFLTTLAWFYLVFATCIDHYIFFHTNKKQLRDKTTCTLCTKWMPKKKISGGSVKTVVV
jgi:hypothetical protein